MARVLGEVTLMQMAVTGRAHERTNRVHSITEFSVWSAAFRMLRQHPEISWLVAAQRADAAHAAGQTFKFRFWSRVALALMEWIREPTMSDAVN